MPPRREFQFVGTPNKACEDTTIITFSIVSQLMGSSYFAQLLGWGWKMAKLEIERDQCGLH
jgi:hypothetical protein